ncbi:acylphosphatase, partial [Collinsella aerofaciens]
MRHAHIHVTGIVQGVGMRPFVYREAMAHGICGWVLNAGDGVHIEAHALSESLDEFVDALSEHAPAASRVEHVEVVDLAPGNWDAANDQGFRIVASQDQT